MDLKKKKVTNQTLLMVQTSTLKKPVDHPGFFGHPRVDSSYVARLPERNPLYKFESSPQKNVRVNYPPKNPPKNLKLKMMCFPMLRNLLSPILS